MPPVYSQHGYVPTNPSGFTPSTAPTAGNLLVLSAHTRAAADKLLAITGWTIIEAAMASSPPSSWNGLSMFYRIAQSGDTTWSIAASQCEISYSEWAGSWVLLESASQNITPGASPYSLECGGAVSPGAVATALIIGAASMGLDNDTDALTVTPDAGVTELDDWNTAPSTNGNPGRWSGYRMIASPSGSYIVSGQASVGATENPYAGITAAFGSGTPPPPSLDFEICGPDGTNCVLIERATAKKIRPEYNGTGTGSFQISRYDVQATNDILATGNIVKVTFTEIDPDPIFEFVLEEGDFTLVSSDEEGGELLSFGGKGTLGLLSYARLGHQWLDTGHPKLNFPSEGLWRWDDALPNVTAAGILRRIIDEAQLHTPSALSDVVHGGDPSPWTDTQDSLGNSFYQLAGTWEIPIGTDLLSAALELAKAGMFQLEMRPGFELWVYDEQGSDKTGDFGTGVVRFEKGINIGGFDNTEVARQISNANYTSNVLIHTKDGYLWYNAGNTTPDYVKESFLDLSGTNSSNDQERAAARSMLRGAEEAQAILLEVTPTGPDGEKNDEALGYYYPGFEGTAHGKYWLGDLITLHTGDNPDLDFMDATFRVYAITLYEDETGAVAPPIIELNAQFTPADSGGSGGSSGGSTSAGGTGAGSSSPTNTPHVHTQYEVTTDDKWHQPVRAATTANITISTALNNGDTLDGVTLATGDRVLVKNQTAAEDNGLYIVGSSPIRTTDFDEDDEVMGSVVLVIDGTANGGKVYRNTNTAVPVVGTDDITFAEVSGSSVVLSDDTPLVESGSGDPGTSDEASRSDHAHPDDGGGGGGTFPLGLAAPDTIPASPGAHDEEWEGTADTLPTNWAWVSSAPTFSINSDYPSWFVIERAVSTTTEYKLRRSSFTMAATSGLWMKIGNGTKNGSSSQFEWIIYDSASSNGYGFGIHNGNVALARDSNAGTLANRGTWTIDDGHAGAYYFGVMRVSDTWQTWFSMDGIHWTEIQSADTRAFTVDRLELRWSTDSAIRARGTVDWIRYRTDNLFPKP